MIKVFAAVFLTLCATIAQAMPDIKTFTTPAGTPAWLVEDHNIPFVALELRFIGGTSMDPMDKRGVTKFMMGLLEEGSGELDAQAFSIAKDQAARGQFAASPGFDRLKHFVVHWDGLMST